MESAGPSRRRSRGKALDLRTTLLWRRDSASACRVGREEAHRARGRRRGDSRPRRPKKSCSERITSTTRRPRAAPPRAPAPGRGGSDTAPDAAGCARNPSLPPGASRAPPGPRAARRFRPDQTSPSEAEGRDSSRPRPADLERRSRGSVVGRGAADAARARLVPRRRPLSGAPPSAPRAALAHATRGGERRERDGASGRVRMMAPSGHERGENRSAHAEVSASS